MITGMKYLALSLILWGLCCKSRQLSEAGISECLVRTDFSGHNPNLRADLGWYISYDKRVRETRCCALQPRIDLLQKRADLKIFKKELLQRVDILEAGTNYEQRAELSQGDLCYRALMDLYHDTVYAERPPR